MSAIDEVGEQASTDKTTAAPLDQVFEFLRLLWAVDHELQSTSKRMESTLGLTGPQRLVVRIVGQFPGITAGRLAQTMHLHPSTITGILKRLEKSGMLQRQSDPLDGRKARFTLTEAGRAHNVPSVGTVEDAVQRALSRVSEVHLTGAQQVLTALAAELGVGNASLHPATDASEKGLRPLQWVGRTKEAEGMGALAKASNA